MWRGLLSLLIFSCTVGRIGALEEDKSAEPSLEQMLVSQAADLSTPDKDGPTTAKVEDGLRGEEQHSPRRDPPVLDVEGEFQGPTAEPLEDEVDNQENIISQVSVILNICRLQTSGVMTNCLQLQHTSPKIN